MRAPREPQPHEAWRRWYGLRIWRRRSAAQLDREPRCEECLRDGGHLQLASIADHIEPHRGDWRKFIGGRLQSLCKHHHDVKTRAEEIEAATGRRPKPRGCDAQGNPLGGWGG